MASQHGSRKRQRVSINESRETSSNMSGATLSSAPKTTGLDAASTMPTPSTRTLSDDCAHVKSLQTLQADVEAMRQLVTCKICDRLMYEPYSLSCGHAYCYSCLSQWLVSNHKKTCPDCRSIILQEPTPSYIIRELVLVFVARTELLPEGETSDEHFKWAREEKEIVAKDKANTDITTGGLFKGCFKHGGRRNTGPLHDPSDGVDRCPACHWELWDGWCDHCEAHFDEEDLLGLTDYDSEDLDDEMTEDDVAALVGVDGFDDGTAYSSSYTSDDTGTAVRGNVPLSNTSHARSMPSSRRGIGAPAQRRGVAATDGPNSSAFPSQANREFYGEGQRGALYEHPARHGNRNPRHANRELEGWPAAEDEDEDDDDDDDDDDSELRDFIVDDTVVEDHEGSEDEDEDEAEDEDIQIGAATSARRTNWPSSRRGAHIVLSDDDDEDSESNTVTSRNNDDGAEQTLARRQRVRAIMSDDGDSDEEESNDGDSVTDCHDISSSLDASDAGTQEHDLATDTEQGEDDIYYGGAEWGSNEGDEDNDYDD